jgi:hypothetical protein
MSVSILRNVTRISVVLVAFLEQARKETIAQTPRRARRTRS